MCPLGTQPTFRVERRHAAAAGAGDRLAIIIVGDVPGGEDSFDASVCAEGNGQLEVPLLVHLQLTVQERCVGCMSNGHKRTAGSQLVGLARLEVFDPHSSNPALSSPRISSTALSQTI